MLTGCDKRTVAAGNIGHAFSDAVEASAGLDALVLEVSSFQLEKIEQFRPNISVLLNITPDHLDRYESMDDYAAAKALVLLNQKPEDTAVISIEALKHLRRMCLPFQARAITFSAYNGAADGWLDPSDNDTIWPRLPQSACGILMKMSETNLRGRCTTRRTCSPAGDRAWRWGCWYRKCAKRLARTIRSRTVVVSL